MLNKFQYSIMVDKFVAFSFHGFKRLFFTENRNGCTMENYAINTITKKSGFQLIYSYHTAASNTKFNYFKAHQIFLF